MAESEDIYEPWHPTVGQRVRIHRSGECRSAHHIADGCDDGLVGTVGEHQVTVEQASLKIQMGRLPMTLHGPVTVRFPSPPDHAYFVWYDRPIPTGITRPATITGQYYAAAELEAEDA